MTNTGHRERLKTKFIRAEGSTLHDYELLELLLFYSIPRKDTKPLAKILLKEYGSLGKVLHSSSQKLSKISGMGKSTTILFKLVREIMQHTTKEQVLSTPILKTSDKLIAYIRANIGYNSTEHLHTLYLNHKNMLIADKTHDHGTVNRISIYPREIVKSSVFYDASGVILVHNHPSGITTPSQADITLTQAVKEALSTITVKLLDHIIISSNSYFSFKMHGLV